MLDVNQNKTRSPQAMPSTTEHLSGTATAYRPSAMARSDDQPTQRSAKMVNPAVSIREAEDDDASQLAEIVAAITREFPGCVFDLEADFPELQRPKSSFKADGGCFWVVETTGMPAGSAKTSPRDIVGCFGFLPAEDPSGIELQRVYLQPDLRGTGLAEKMFKIVQAVARQRSAGFIELWTDSRFKAAQRFYEKLGFRRLPNERLLNDRNRSSELHYLLALT